MLVTVRSQRLYNPYEVVMVVRRTSEWDLVINLDKKRSAMSKTGLAIFEPVWSAGREDVLKQK